MKSKLLYLLVFFILAGLYFKLIGPIPLSVNQVSTQKAATFDVTGEGSVTVVPDQAQVTLGISLTRPTVTAAQEQVNQTIANITKALKDNGVGERDIKTTNYSINPQYDYRQGQRLTGYIVTANLQVKVTDFNKLNQTIDQATDLGANQIGSITFTLSDDKQTEAEDEARKQAVNQAKAKAQSLARAAGIKLGKIINVQESISPPPGPIFRSLEATADTSAKPNPPTQIEPGSTQVRLTVILSYETL